MNMSKHCLIIMYKVTSSTLEVTEVIEEDDEYYYSFGSGAKVYKNCWKKNMKKRNKSKWNSCKHWFITDTLQSKMLETQPVHTYSSDLRVSIHNQIHEL